jgi:hypothetical protein
LENPSSGIQLPQQVKSLLETHILIFKQRSSEIKQNQKWALNNVILHAVYIFKLAGNSISVK